MPSIRNLLIALVILAVLGLAYIIVAPDQRTTTQKIGDAIHELPQGADKASQELDSDRTPGQKIGDAFRNAGDKIKENSDQQ
jgi:hypothetical protein